ncbi:MAG TPA: TIGR03854 family LLM class F420-dependent oxidoreductase [Pseudonocardiaceae bacterium]|nr:TIGR03854 family LLM class F420-dependent oxidoreductase [Pseudonocardiaceae bacterium]
MKVRIGVGLGQDSDPAGFGATVDRLEAAGIDSLWLSELVYSRQVEPFVGMAHALGRTTKLKVGTGIAVLPGRHPVLVAKQLVSLAALAPRRVLPAFGLRPAQRAEWPLFAVPPGRRAAVFDESLRLLRLLLTQDEVTFDGEFHSVTGATVGPRPAKPLDIWLGGAAPAALERIGRLADGWLGSFLDPTQARAARIAIQAAAAAAGREIEEDHFGLSLGVALTGVTDAQLAAARRRRPEADPTELIADGWQRARTLLERHIEGGLSKFVIRPLGAVPYEEFLSGFRSELLPLQN